MSGLPTKDPELAKNYRESFTNAINLDVLEIQIKGAFSGLRQFWQQFLPFKNDEKCFLFI